MEALRSNRTNSMLLIIRTTVRLSLRLNTNIKIESFNQCRNYFVFIKLHVYYFRFFFFKISVLLSWSSVLKQHIPEI